MVSVTISDKHRAAFKLMGWKGPDDIAAMQKQISDLSAQLAKFQVPVERKDVIAAMSVIDGVPIAVVEQSLADNDKQNALFGYMVDVFEALRANHNNLG